MQGIPRHETFEHGADIGIRGLGRSQSEAFVLAARAMFSLMAEDLERIPAETEVQIEVSGFDSESLLLAWLNQLLAEADINRVLFCKFQVELSGHELRGTAAGSELGEMEPGVEVKAATYSEAAVFREGEAWVAQCVVDV